MSDNLTGQRCCDCDCRLIHESPDGRCRECRADYAQEDDST
jgi:hypothetical protein